MTATRDLKPFSLRHNLLRLQINTTDKHAHASLQANVHRRRDGLVVALDAGKDADHSDEDELISPDESLGSTSSTPASSPQAANIPTNNSPDMHAFPYIFREPIAPARPPPETTRTWVESQGKAKLRSRPQKPSQTEPTRAFSPATRRRDPLLPLLSSRIVKKSRPGAIHGDPAHLRRCDPLGLDVTPAGLALFDAMAAHASVTYEREQQALTLSAPPADFERTTDREEAMARGVYRAMCDEHLAFQAARPDEMVEAPSGPHVFESPPNIPRYLEESEQSETTRREDEAMVDMWRYVYSVIRRSPSQRLCAYVQVSAEDAHGLLRQVGEHGMNCTLFRKGSEWFLIVTDEEDAGFSQAFMERRLNGANVGENGLQKLAWGTDVLVLDCAVKTAVDGARASGKAPVWPMQYTTGRLHLLIVWMDLEW